MRMLLGRGMLLAVVSGMVLAGCGSEGIPTDASVKEFCKAGDKFSTATKFSEGVKAANGLHDTGTPRDIPDKARDGFELVVKLVGEAKDQKDLETRYNKLSATDKKSIEALDAYIGKTC